MKFETFQIIVMILLGIYILGFIIAFITYWTKGSVRKKTLGESLWFASVWFFFILVWTGIGKPKKKEEPSVPKASASRRKTQQKWMTCLRCGRRIYTDIFHRLCRRCKEKGNS